jgi:hypothetical protein
VYRNSSKEVRDMRRVIGLLLIVAGTVREALGVHGWRALLAAPSGTPPASISMFERGRRFNGLRATMDLGHLGLVVVLLGGCVTEETVATKLRRVQVDVVEARRAAEDGGARGDRTAAMANAVAALRALGDAQAWVDAYATAHGPRASDQFEPALRRIAADAGAARASALKTGATRQSIDAEVNRGRSPVQAGGAGGGGGAGAGAGAGM